MEPPLCNICKPPRRHWQSEPHRFGVVKGGRGVVGVVHALVAPPGECEYCDRRRAYAAEKMRVVRERRQKGGG